jgi:hypothetical protein
MKKLLYIFLFFSQIVVSQVAVLDTNTILIGDQIKLNITLQLDHDEKYVWPTFTDSVYKKVEIISKGKLQETTKENSTIISQQLVITCFDSGSYYLPPFIFNENKKTEGLILKVNPIILNDSVFMIPNTPLKIGKNEDLTKKEREDERRNKWKKILILLAISLITILIYYLIRKYKRNGAILKPKVIIPAHITALKRLQSLEKEELWQKGELKEYYSKISLILREYTEHRFRFSALELPTSEIEYYLKSVNKEWSIILVAILRRADNIKYAKGLSLEEDNKITMIQSVEFINKSKLEEDEANR